MISCSRTNTYYNIIIIVLLILLIIIIIIIKLLYFLKHMHLGLIETAVC